jgi:hypothetical protein
LAPIDEAAPIKGVWRASPELIARAENGEAYARLLVDAGGEGVSFDPKVVGEGVREMYPTLIRQDSPVKAHDLAEKWAADGLIATADEALIIDLLVKQKARPGSKINQAGIDIRSELAGIEQETSVKNLKFLMEGLIKDNSPEGEALMAAAAKRVNDLKKAPVLSAEDIKYQRRIAAEAKARADSERIASMTNREDVVAIINGKPKRPKAQIDAAKVALARIDAAARAAKNK